MKKKLFLHFRIKTTMLESNREYKDFFEAHFEAVWRFARQIVNDGDVAQDIAQDAFVRLYEYRKDFDVLEKARSFVYLTARNLAVDWLRGQKAVDRYITMHEEEPIDLPCLKSNRDRRHFGVSFTCESKVLDLMRHIKPYFPVSFFFSFYHR